MRKALITILFTAVFAVCSAQTKINPVTQINWPLITGSGTPTGLSLVCTSVNYGQPYQNLAVTPNTFYTCGNDGWAVRGGSGSGGINQLTGDGTAGPGTGSQALTLSTVNSNVGSCGDATHVGQVTLNAKGLTTGCTAVAITAGAVSSVFGRTGTVVAVSGDYTVSQVTGAAPLASPALTGTPTVPTAAVNTNTTQAASTAYVVGQAGTANPLIDGTVAVGTSLLYARQDHVHPTDTTRAPATGSTAYVQTSPSGSQTQTQPANSSYTVIGASNSTFNAATLPATNVVPSGSLQPLYTAVQWPYEFVSVQGTAPSSVYVYNISTGAQVLVGSTSFSGCAFVNGLATTNIAGVNILVAGCNDLGTLYTFSISSAGALTALGSVSGLTNAYPGIAIDGTDVYVPLFGAATTTTGSVAKVSIATPASPSITATVALAGSAQNPAYLAVSGNYVYVEAGHEPVATNDSTIQVVNKTTMTLVGAPLALPHSPQQVYIQGQILYVTNHDQETLSSVDIANPANLAVLQTISLPSCAPVPVTVRDTYAYVGCYDGAAILKVDVSQPSNMLIAQTFSGFGHPQQFFAAGRFLFSTDNATGGSVYMSDTGGYYAQQLAATNGFIKYLGVKDVFADASYVKNNGHFGGTVVANGFTDPLLSTAGCVTNTSAGAFGTTPCGTGTLLSQIVPNAATATGQNYNFGANDLGVASGHTLYNGTILIGPDTITDSGAPLLLAGGGYGAANSNYVLMGCGPPTSAGDITIFSMCGSNLNGVQTTVYNTNPNATRGASGDYLNDVSGHIVEIGISGSTSTNSNPIPAPGASYIMTEHTDLNMGDTQGIGSVNLFANSILTLQVNGTDGLVHFPTIATSPSTATLCLNGTNGGLTDIGCAGGSSSDTQTAGTGGVVANKLVAEDASNPTKFITAAVGACGAGVAGSTVSAGATFTLQDLNSGGPITVVVDAGGAVAGHVLIGSTVTAGDVMDSGLLSTTTIPLETSVCGVALANASGSATVSMLPRARGSLGRKVDQVNSAAVPATGGITTTNSLGQIKNLVHLSNFMCAGDSMSVAIGSTVPQQLGQCALLARDTPTSIFANVASSGVTSSYTSTAFVNAWDPNPNGQSLAFFDAQNDANLDNCGGTTGTACMLQAQAEVLAELAWAVIPYQYRQYASVSAPTGTWTVDTTLNNANTQIGYLAHGTFMKSSVSGSTRTFSIPSSASTKVGLTWIVQNGQTGTFTVTVDTVPVVDPCTGSTTFSSAPCVAMLTSTVAPFRKEFTVTPNTTHSVVVTTTSSSNSGIISVDWNPPPGTYNENYAIFENTMPNFPNFAVYNTMYASIISTLQSDGLQVVLSDLIGGIPGAGTAADVATIATATCKATATPGHLNDCGNVNAELTSINAAYAAGYYLSTYTAASNAMTSGIQTLPPQWASSSQGVASRRGSFARTNAVTAQGLTPNVQNVLNGINMYDGAPGYLGVGITTLPSSSAPFSGAFATHLYGFASAWGCFSKDSGVLALTTAIYTPQWCVSFNTGNSYQLGSSTATQFVSTLGSAAITSATPVTGSTATCATATCTIARGTYTIGGGTATTGTFLTLVWPTTTTAWACSVTPQGTGTTFGITHSVAAATGMTISATSTIAGASFTIDYSCQP